MQVCYRLAYRSDHLVGGMAVVRVAFLNHDESLFAIRLYREGCAGVHAQRRMARLDRLLDILGIMIEPSNNDQVFEPPGNEQFPFIHEPEITCPQKWPFVGVKQDGLKL